MFFFSKFEINARNDIMYVQHHNVLSCLLDVLVYPVGDLVVDWDKGNGQSEEVISQQYVGVVLRQDHPFSSFLTRCLGDVVVV